MCAICNFKLDFSVGHPLALKIAVAARKAIDAGLIDAVDTTEGALSAARMRLSAIEALNLLQARVETAHGEAALLALPDFYVLLIENDTWGFFHATTVGFDPDIVPEMPDVTATEDALHSNIVITSEAALRAWLDGRFQLARALEDDLFVIDAPQTHAASLTQMLASAEAATLAVG
ncbi:hypothetical protein G3N59_16905 [Paraburkholderia sp. Ac-20340]|uniref:hypothetical protein n=1 Tax=Paraburkholderia sp. Ac-20340 TaxID=2703888 RepID=UPI00197DD78B|nr:hypothetical protein [Paraburkholderia sp. Ac-20340]MBN3855062.1 hypothetical protein [Paraburkholderia sp. Ac-20340]